MKNENLKLDLLKKESGKSVLELLKDIQDCNFSCVAGDLKNHAGWITLLEKFAEDEDGKE